MTLIRHRPDRDSIFEELRLCACVFLAKSVSASASMHGCVAEYTVNQRSSQGVHGGTAGGPPIIQTKFCEK